MRNRFLIRCVIAVLFQLDWVSGAAPQSVSVTVQRGERQTFAGFGASLINWRGDYQKLTSAEQATLSGMLWGDLKFRHLRLWCHLDHYASEPGRRDSSEFRQWYVESGLIRDAKKAGATTLLLAPDGIPAYLTVKTPPDGDQPGVRLKDGAEDDYACLLADFCAQLRDETGILLDVTGIQNEPNDNERILPAQLARIVKTLRRELDQRGLRSLGIIAPENANADDALLAHLDALRGDAEAWRGLRGVASHSYNMAATEEVGRRRDGKEYWMTEAGDNGPEEPGDARRAASLASRFLNDLNHGVTHWTHFIGFEYPDPKDNATRILSYTAQPFRVSTFQKFHYYGQLAAAFEVGGVVRTSLSETEGGMTWTHGKKPRLTVACARNPGGRWALALSNYTDRGFRNAGDTGRWEIDQGGHAARTFTVALRLEELSGEASVPFTITRSREKGASAEAGRVVFRDGQAAVTVSPLELVTLRSDIPP